MRKLFLVLFVSISLAGCSSNENSAESVDLTAEDESQKHEDILPIGILAYAEQITGKYIMTDMYEDGEEKQLQLLTKASIDVELAMIELEADYDPDIPAVKDLIELAVSVDNALDEMIIGEFSTKYDNSVEAGQLLGELSRNYLDGELPPTVKAFTEKESAND
ncbi:hypothetical protein [Planomicrobium sp. YIM 101495]|uniref:hypothetical protein n=1 Tax=Planomicrobium sp. YIM 101495 TaxID=2665160 RepID=UPI0012B920E7|nr:hypothetical protein [Planomicrobium sp. YIM 101495]MTD30195.1 hypothetical protein [Planomicrobium sp. YIM 101495]